MTGNIMSKSAPRIGSLGELLVEFICTSKDGHNRVAATYEGPYASGAPGIFIDQAARVGASAIFAGAVGDDAFGGVITDRLVAVGVDDRLIARIAGVPTGSAFVSYNSDGSRDFVFNIAHSAASALPGIENLLAELANFRTEIFHISGSTLGDPAMRTTALAVCRALHGQGTAISFDPNVRKELLRDRGYLDAVSELMGLSRYFLPSEEDAEVLFPGQSFDTYAATLIGMGVSHVVLKRGALGCMAMTADGETASLGAHAVTVVDPTGAGDCFCATFVTLSASGMGLSAALARANAAGALAVGRTGPMEGNASLAEIEAFLEARA
jgi:sugar/nucleoside kinase (ribokinase family)